MVFSQGDIIKIHGYKGKFIIVSKNAFIKATNVFHVCPVFEYD
jgi:mRNA interferase MazF